MQVAFVREKNVWPKKLNDLISPKIGYIDAENDETLNQIIISIELQVTGLIKTFKNITHIRAV